MSESVLLFFCSDCHKENWWFDSKRISGGGRIQTLDLQVKRWVLTPGNTVPQNLSFFLFFLSFFLSFFLYTLPFLLLLQCPWFHHRILYLVFIEKVWRTKTAFLWFSDCGTWELYLKVDIQRNLKFEIRLLHLYCTKSWNNMNHRKRNSLHEKQVVLWVKWTFHVRQSPGPWYKIEN